MEDLVIQPLISYYTSCTALSLVPRPRTQGSTLCNIQLTTNCTNAWQTVTLIEHTIN